MSNGGEPGPDAAATQAVLDSAQFRRIQAVHRGFLYQHLYAVGCLLKSASTGVESVAVERDEDVELITTSSRVYVQVKTRASTLARADVVEALTRFDQLREAHARGERAGVARFRIVSNVPPNAPLAADLRACGWPADVELSWPGLSTEASNEMPPPWPDIEQAFRWCVEAATAIPFLSVAPETLVWKLAARVQFAATGDDRERHNHSFATGDLPALFEQFVQQLQDFPLVPADYRPQTDEPPLETPARVRLIVAFSGAGKTAWASHVARHSAGPTAYFDAGDLPCGAVASALARELAARFLGGRAGGVGAAVLPAGSGIDILRAIDRRLCAETAPIVVLDNAHRVLASDLRGILDACPSLRFILLAQPWNAQLELEALIGVRAETLPGWGTDTVAAEFAARGCRIDPGTAQRWRTDTAGMPLYVRNAAQLAAAHYQGDAARLADEVEAQVHATTTVQEIILGRVAEALPGDTRAALALLSLAGLPLARSEADRLLSVALPNAGPAMGRALRELTAIGALQAFQDGRIKVHDAMRPIGRALQADLLSGVLSKAQITLRDLLLESFREHPDLSRFGLWLRLLAPTGQIDTLVDVATQEYFHEAGDPSDLRAVLEAAAQSDDQSDEARFWTLDALAFWDWQHGCRSEEFAKRLSSMAQVIARGSLGDRERSALGMKRMLAASTSGDPAQVDQVYRECERECGDSPALMRVLRYNRAAAFFHLGRFLRAEREAEMLAKEYYEVIGLSPADVVGVNPPAIVAAIGGIEEHQDDLKHLADCLDLYAIARAKRGLHSGLARLHAMKFYTMSGAYRSAVRTGQEAVDDFIAIQHDAEGARQLIENHLLPLVRQFGLTANEVPVRAQYAVILAYCGQAHAAQVEMRRLEPFAAALPDASRSEFESQRHLVEAINAGLVEKPQLQRPAPSVRHGEGFGKVGRNQPCPCGSGKKFKRCHGA